MSSRQLADHPVIMDNGEVVASGGVDAVMNRTELPPLVVGVGMLFFFQPQRVWQNPGRGGD